jgi:DNA-directed RNA polymerase subunit N (RpoN/RPB10)
MLPPKCFTCGRIFADIELDYEKKVVELEINKKNLTIEEIKQEKC